MLGKLYEDLKLRYYLDSHKDSENNWISRPYAFVLDFILGIRLGLIFISAFAVVLAFAFVFGFLIVRDMYVSMVLYLLFLYGLLHAIGGK